MPDYAVIGDTLKEVVVTEQFFLELPDQNAMRFAKKWKSPVILSKELSDDGLRYDFFIGINTDDTEAHFNYDEEDTEFDEDRQEALGFDERYDGNYVWGSVKDSTVSEKLLNAWFCACKEVYPKNNFMRHTS